MRRKKPILVSVVENALKETWKSIPSIIYEEFRAEGESHKEIMRILRSLKFKKGHKVYYCNPTLNRTQTFTI